MTTLLQWFLDSKGVGTATLARVTGIDGDRLAALASGDAEAAAVMTPAQVRDLYRRLGMAFEDPVTLATHVAELHDSPEETMRAARARYNAERNRRRRIGRPR